MIKIEERLDKIEDMFNSINNQINSLESKLVVIAEEFSNNLNQKADIKATNLLLEGIILLEMFKENYEKTQVKQESYDKRLNILIGGTKENR